MNEEWTTWDSEGVQFIDTPTEMIGFFSEIEAVCKKYNLSISHEDLHGNFIIERYDDENISWLKSATKSY